MRRPLTVAVTVVALVITASPSFASGPHRTARHHRSAPQSYLVWSLLGDYESNTESVRAPLVLARGGQVVPLTHPGVGQQDIEPRISPNGRWILFERDYPEGSDAWIVGLDGGGEHRLHLGCAAPCYGTKGGLNDRLRGPTPSWTRDGRHILYTRFSGPFKSNGDAASANLWKYDLKSHRNTRFSSRRLHPTTEETYPTFAPAGYLIVLHVRKGGHTAIFRERANGTHPRRLTRWSLDADLPRVSPARSGPSRNRIVFVTHGHHTPPGLAPGQQVATISATCRSVARCTKSIRYLTRSRSPESDSTPAWAPDGRRIVYTHSVNSEAIISADIWSMLWNGSGKHPVSQDKHFEAWPAWGSVR
jgi:Tol biopolymer transport system component